MNQKFEVLNEDWLNEFEKTDKLFQDFYLDDIYYTEIHFIYININNTIEKIKEEQFLLKVPNIISREEIVGLLKRNIILDNKRYSILSILKCNITLKPEEIKGFLSSTNSFAYLDNFLEPIKNFNDIVFEKTINMFQDLNDLLFIFYEKSDEEIKRTANNATKKIYLNNKSNHKKTIRKDY
jgi:hypothetical protein